MATFVASLWLVLCAPGVEPVAAATPVSPETIAAAVAQLGSGRFAQREAATEWLIRAGAPARDAVAQAVKCRDAEVVSRAEIVLECLTWEIAADSAVETLLLVKEFQTGDEALRVKVIKRLGELKQRRTAILLVRSLGSEPSKGLAWRYSIELEFAVNAALVAGDRAEAERCLRDKAELDVDHYGDRDLATFLLLTGKLDAEIAQARAEMKQRGGKTSNRLARLLLMRGDDAAARDVCASDQKGTGQEIALRLRDWSGVFSTSGLGSPGVEKLGFAALANQLQGNRAQTDAALEQLVQHAAAKPDEAWSSAKCALVCDASPTARRILAAQPSGRFQFDCGALRFKQALLDVGLDDAGLGDTRSPQPWFAETPTTPLKDYTAEMRRFQLGVNVAPVLHRLGETEAAAQLLNELGMVKLSDDANRGYSWLISAALKCERREIAERVALLRLQNDQVADLVFSGFYPDSRQARMAEACWRYLRNQSPDEPLSVIWQRHQRMITPGSAPQLDRPQLDAIAAALEATVPAHQPNGRAIGFAAAAQLCLLHKDRPGAEYCLLKQIDAEPEYKPVAGDGTEMSSVITARIQIGDLHFELGEWSQAAAAYEKAWQVDRRFPLPAYLLGRTLVEQGEERRGRELKQLASLLPLANASRRDSLAEGLEERGLKAEALVEWKRIVQIGPQYPWYDWHVHNAAWQVADRIEKIDPTSAVDLWRLALFPLNYTNWFLTTIDDYREVQMHAHRSAARMHFKAGKLDDAVAEIRAARTIRPAFGPLVEEFVPQLDAAGRRADADAIFAEAYAELDQVCGDFPRAAYYHNNLAWMAARCDRRLDDALRHAEEAVRLRPERAAYLDTLAEVCFRRGDRDRAMEWTERALELEPKNKQLMERLARFRSTLLNVRD